MTFYGDREILRDSRGHTACISCGRVVSRRVEIYSIKNFGRVLCFDCQKKQRLLEDELGGDK